MERYGLCKKSSFFVQDKGSVHFGRVRYIFMKKLLLFIGCIVIASVYFPIDVYGEDKDNSSNQIIVETTNLRSSVLNLAYSANVSDPVLLPQQQSFKLSLINLYDNYIKDITKYYQSINNLNTVIETYYDSYDDVFLNNDKAVIDAINEINYLIKDQKNLIYNLAEGGNIQKLQTCVKCFSDSLTNHISNTNDSEKIKTLKQEIRDIETDINWFSSTRTSNIITAVLSGVALASMIAVGVFVAIGTGGTATPVLMAALPIIVGSISLTPGIVTGGVGAKEAEAKVAALREKVEKKYQELSEVEKESIKNELLSNQLVDINENLECITSVSENLTYATQKLKLTVPDKVSNNGVINHAMIKADMKRLSKEVKTLKEKADLGIQMLTSPVTGQN